MAIEQLAIWMATALASKMPHRLDGTTMPD
jgi:hypothetical protein